MRPLKYLLATLLFIVFLELNAAVVGMLFYYVIEDMFHRAYKYALLATTIVEAAAIFYLLFLIYKKKLLYFFKVPYRLSFIAISLGAAFVFIQTPLNIIYNAIFNTDHNIIYDFVMTKTSQRESLATVLFIPLAEELFFRGYIQQGLNKYMKPVFAILISSVLFSLIHLQTFAIFFPNADYLNLDIHLTYITFFGGLISALLYHKSKSFVPSILFHMSWNLWAIIV
ncbi:CPBP family intramembrane glutamic endopeptidase [Psychroserpens luteolus]|uniref:CPBP family intramembrane glutamic endopeptidase n=1 Tax=Psychroserpens luteolus TaxID=2855840 RepID=UPI001E4A3BA7|nr:type II CAAX endopeptidase family protein [Psychroserpens luteolus]MCD2259780.1 CPBP family intramembrane metalloprotease [Psychroserpens luteolus]